MQNLKSGIIGAASIALSSKLINKRENHLQAKSIGKLFQRSQSTFLSWNSLNNDKIKHGHPVKALSRAKDFLERQHLTTLHGQTLSPIELAVQAKGMYLFIPWLRTI